MSDEQDISGSNKRLSDDEFREACDLYERDVMGLGQIADKFGISRQALSKRFKDNGVKRGAKSGQPMQPAPSQPVERYAELRPDWIEETRLQGYKALKQASLLARKTVSDAVKNGQSMETIDGDLRAIQRFNKVLCDNIQTTMKLLEAENYVSEDELPRLDIQDLTDEEILEHHKTTGALPEDATLEDLVNEELEIPE